MAGTRRIEGAGSSNTNDRIHQPRFVVGRKWHGGGKLSRPKAANYRTAALHQFAGRKRRYQCDLRPGRTGQLGGWIVAVPAAAPSVRRWGMGPVRFCETC